MGETLTNFWDTLPTDVYDYYILSDSEWVASDRLNAGTNHNFTSWQDFYDPQEYSGDTFTTNQRHGFSSSIFDEEGLGIGFQTTKSEDLADQPTKVLPSFAAAGIVILSDGLCSSACALFMEMMHHQTGVKTVVVGGKPNYGPMQAPAGTHGARSYTSGHLNQDINITKRLNNNTAVLLPARELDYWISYASVNLRDQIREGQAGIPLQFVYEAPDCRVFYTKDTYNNYSNLWQYAADAIWSDPSKCVKGSTGHATYGKNTDRIGPPQPPPSTNTMYGIPTITQSAGPQNAIPVSI
ncbi:hypothetical protein OEA41_008397 [Lepraria neglecta]|uniref:Uncharacterized protein n=1 Tax=Lepraria neglecta TaxID=209136 RepID=A0AAD9ZI20_9LECA|nr:hypothetical protein OEA41_008397 [Lepraria neglecta]